MSSSSSSGSSASDAGRSLLDPGDYRVLVADSSPSLRAGLARTVADLGYQGAARRGGRWGGDWRVGGAGRARRGAGAHAAARESRRTRKTEKKKRGKERKKRKK